METREAFTEVLSDVFEQFAFMFVDSDGSTDFQQYKGEFLHASITFNGPTKGIVCISAPETLCQELAMNILGDDSADDATSEDALKEISNIVCGKLTEKLFGNEDIYDLTVPSSYRIYKDKWNELAADHDALFLYVENQPLLASLTIEEN